jgi:type I restriction-modification system DNA methylase subunit
MADALRGSMDAGEYKHVVLGLLFLKYISDAFEEKHAQLEAERAQGADPGSGRVSGAQYFLGTARGALVAPEGPGQAADHRSDGG